MGAIIEARNKLDKEFIIISRIDAGAIIGDDEAIAGQSCAKLVSISSSRKLPPCASLNMCKSQSGLCAFSMANGAPEVMKKSGVGPHGFTAKL